nr:MAG TPA: hypothetical protein [Caudoviricetes sp.]
MGTHMSIDTTNKYVGTHTAIFVIFYMDTHIYM